MALCLLMMVVVMIERFALTPNIIRLGRIIDFLPPDPKLPDRLSFGAFHGAYSLLDVLKLALGLIIAGILIIRRQPDPQMFAREAEESLENAPVRRSTR